MTFTDFKKIITTFKERSLPGRKLYIWRGSKEKILDYLPTDIVRELDVLQIAPQGVIDERAQIQKGIKKAIAQKLEEYILNLQVQQILVVSNIHLLARYKVSLVSFYEIYFSDKTLVILTVPMEKVDTQLPAYVSFEDDFTLKYLKEVLSEEHKFNIIEEV